MTNGKNSAPQIAKEISTGLKKEKGSSPRRKSRRRHYTQGMPQGLVKAIMKELNQRHWVFRENAQECLILTEEFYPELGFSMFVLTDPEVLRREYADRTWFDGAREHSIVDVWLNHPKRRRYDGPLLSNPHIGIMVPIHEVLRNLPIYYEPNEEDCSL